MICFPNSKINLGLHIINKREDGFHNIESVFYPVDLCDALEVIETKKYHAKNKCLFASGGLKITGNTQNNLVVKAYELLNEKYDLPPVKVYLQKNIPMGAGLGGGSSDAAYMLKLLNNLFTLNITDTELHEHAAKLGSDCAFFIQNKPAYLLGKGHELTPINFSLRNTDIVMVFTGAHSNTALAYKHATPRNNFNDHKKISTLLRQKQSDWKNNVVNDFEESVFKQIPHLSEVKQWLYKQGAYYAAMSGSGSCMFGLFNGKPKLNGTWTKHVIHQ